MAGSYTGMTNIQNQVLQKSLPIFLKHDFYLFSH